MPTYFLSTGYNPEQSAITERRIRVSRFSTCETKLMA